MIQEILQLWKKVFSHWKYVFLFFMFSIGFYFFNVFLYNVTTLGDFFSELGFFGSMKLFFRLALGFYETVMLHSFLSLLTISFLFGCLFSLIVYKAKLNLEYSDKKTTWLGSVGAFFAILIPGCSACGIGIVSVLGISASALHFLPFDGIEISFISILLLVATIFYLSKNMYVCRIAPRREAEEKSPSANNVALRAKQ